MSEVHVRQLRQFFLNSVAPHLDVTDLSRRSPGEREKATLSRALTAFTLASLSGVSAVEAAKAVVDGHRDQGIDGILFDQTRNNLIFVQAKWNDAGTKTVGKGEILKFLNGVKLVLGTNWTSFSDRLRAQSGQIEDVLLKPDVTVSVVIAFTGDNKLGEECEEALVQFKKEQNVIEEFLDTRVLDLRSLHRFFRAATLAAQPPFTGMLLDWGQSTDPYNAVYGRICCEELAKLYRDVGEPLFEPNIRSFLGDGEVNSQIVGTLLTRPEDFWYLNNGVTAICTKFTKTALGGGDNRHAATFVFEGIQVVNGAQTVGSIARAFEKSPDKVSRGFAMLKVIALEGAPLGFTDVVTVATNRQNKVEEKDFLALEQNQNRIKMEMASKGIQYAYRSGESVADRTMGFDVTEAMVALACSSKDVGNAVLAKRNIGLLLDRKSTIYQSLLAADVSGQEIWTKVQKLRRVDEALARVQSSQTDPKRKQICTHGNRFFAWAVFNKGASVNEDDAKGIDAFLREVGREVEAFIKEKYPDSYLAVLFKNSQKCAELASVVRGAHAKVTHDRRHGQHLAKGTAPGRVKTAKTKRAR